MSPATGDGRHGGNDRCQRLRGRRENGGATQLGVDVTVELKLCQLHRYETRLVHGVEGILMIVVEESIVIGRTAEDVFAYVTDFRHSQEWQDTALEIRKVTDGPVRVGTRFEGIRKVMGRKMEVAVEFVHQAKLPCEVDGHRGPMSGEALYRMESSPEGTKVTNRIELRPSGLSRLAGPLVAAGIRRDVRTAQRRLKELLESETGISS